MARRQSVIVIVVLFTRLSVPMEGVQAQVISPGKLSQVHGHLEGVRRCTDCHELRKRGALDDKCLACHAPLRNRLQRKLGFHATVADRTCASCHAEHRGSEVSIVDLDTTRFDHSKTGFELVDGHKDVRCKDCHQPALIKAADVRSFKTEHRALERTLLGLGTTCLDCHERDDPHTDQFEGRGCPDCHSEKTWKAAEGFDHSQTRYRLTGQHRQTECRDCHKPIKNRQGQPTLNFAPVAFASCESCHRDVHERELGANCTSCHNTANWHRVERRSVEDRLDHSGTEFPLLGKHADADCEDCHGRYPVRNDRLRMSFKPKTQSFAYPHPYFERCTSCHLDYHRSAFADRPGGIACDGCHDEYGWVPGKYDIERHNRDAEYALEGAHLAVACTECHPSPDRGQEVEQFRSRGDDCLSCHERDDPHAEQFGAQPCENCHDTRAFRIPEFDHAPTRYPLDGAHRDVPCESCHEETTDPDGTKVTRYKPLRTECRDCHGGKYD